MNASVKKRKVYFLINSLERAGGERVMIELAREISKTRQVKIITLKDANGYECPVEQVTLSSARSGGVMYSLLPVYVSRLKKVIAAEKPDTIISFFELSNVINILATRQTGTNCVISVRATPSEVYTGGVYSKVINGAIRRYYPKADVIVANSYVTKDDLERNYGIPAGKIKVCYNTINSEFIRKSAKELLEPRYQKIFSGSPVLLNAGRLTEQKAQFNLVKIFSEVKKEFPQAALVILGEGHLKKKIEVTAAKLGVEDSVFLLGNQKNPFKFIARADIFLFPSFFEGFPNALVEAMACGVPVVATDCKSGPREILAPGTRTSRAAKKVELARHGIITPLFRRGFYDELSSEEKMFANATVRLLREKSLMKKYSSSGLIRVKDFNSKKVASQFLSIAEGKMLKNNASHRNE